MKDLGKALEKLVKKHGADLFLCVVGKKHGKQIEISCAIEGNNWSLGLLLADLISRQKDRGDLEKAQNLLEILSIALYFSREVPCKSESRLPPVLKEERES